MDIFGSSLSTLRYKDLNKLDAGEQDLLKKEFSTMMWNEVMKSMEKCDEAICSEFSRGTYDQLTSLRYQMLAQKMGQEFTLDFSSIFPKDEQLKQDSCGDPTPTSHYARTRKRPDTLKALEALTPIQDNNSSTLATVEHSHEPTPLDMASFNSPEEFIEHLLPLVRQLNPHEKSIPSEAVLAQAALETGWGQKILGHKDDNPSFNLFNIKASNKQWSGSKIVKNALEVIDGSVKKIKSSFRSYEGFKESIEDYFQFITQGRYKSASQNSQSEGEYIDGIAKAGYATDPQYAEKIKAITKRIQGYLYGGSRL